MQADGYKLFVGGLPRDITPEELQAVFPTYGEVVSVHVVPSSAEKSKTGHCCAFVIYKTKEAAEDAISVLDGKYKIREGEGVQPIHVSWPRPKDFAGKGKVDMGFKGKGDGFGCKGKGGCGGPGYGGPANSWDNSWKGGGGGWQQSSWGGDRGWQQGGWDNGGWGGDKGGWGGDKGGWGGDKGGWGCEKGKGQYGGGKGGGADYFGGYGGGKGCDHGKASKGWSKDGGGGCGGDGLEAGKLFVGNLPGDINEESMKYVFDNYGKVLKIHIMSGRAKSGQACAFVEYGSQPEAETAIATLHDKYEIRPGDGPILVKRSNDRRRSAPY
eukprot:TRINITY_DN16279_c0_g1_i1.p1 TRINITY_DN16279_c0_g1~~TRINITY_DN16279_c0_g1_i1.p1  ORF type:complete len:349 (-),score=66.55 TRINITY_DN16279_c0_g1_i1:216-1193(-)